MDLLYRQTHGSKFSELCSSFCNLLKLNNARVLFRRLEKEVQRVKKAATEFKTAMFEQDIGRDARTYANN